MVNVNVSNRVSIPQLEFLAQCMGQFPSLALANYGKSREETTRAHRKWLQIGSALSKIKPGVTKTGLGWLKYWTNYKHQLRKRYPQYTLSWVSDELVRVTPIESRFLRILADHEKNQPSHVTFQGDTESYPTRKEEECILTTQKECSQSTEQTSQPVPTIHVDVSTDRKLTSPVQDDCKQDEEDEKQDDYDYNLIEDPIGTEKATKEEIQVEILKYTLKRQREMHELEVEQMKERHTLEIEILQLKKKKLILDCDRLRSNVYT